MLNLNFCLIDTFLPYYGITVSPLLINAHVVDKPMLCNDLQEWSYLRGGLTTVDRDYGWINNIHHDIGTHVIHHLFPQIPHYHLVEAVSALLHYCILLLLLCLIYMYSYQVHYYYF